MTLILYLLRLLSAAVVISAGGLFFIVIPPAVVSAVHMLGGVDMGLLLGYLPLVMVDMVPYLLPIGFLLAVVSTYGRIAADNEWTAISMAGIHPLRMTIPALIVACALGGVSHWLTTEVSPHLSFAKREYQRDAISKAIRDVNPGRTEFALKEFYLSAQSRDPQSKTFRDVTIHLPDKLRFGGASSIAGSTVLADVAEFSFRDDIMRIDLTRPRSIDAERPLHLGRLSVELDLDELLQTKPKNRSDWRFQTSSDLERMIDSGQVAPQDVRKATYELHNRRTRTAAYFLFLMLGIPTGLLLRRGTQLGALTAAVGYALVYYLLSMRLGKTLAGWGTVPPAAAAWTTTALGCSAGAVLCWRAFRR